MSDLKSFIEELKRLNPLEDVVGEFPQFEVHKSGRGTFKGVHHDSFVVFPSTQTWTWYSKGEQFKGRDVVEFLESIQNMGFRGALEYLARRANVPMTWNEADGERLRATRQRSDALTTMMHWLNEQLAADASATSYIEGRGWTLDTVKGCGYWHKRMQTPLRKHLELHEIPLALPVVQAIMGAPSDMLVYGHWAGNRCEYVSFRGVGAKRHYNPPSDLMGERQPMWNESARGAPFVVVVEGQADVLTLEQWNIAGVALAGLTAPDKLAQQLSKYDRVFVALDGDMAGKKAIAQLAQRLGVTTRVVMWPSVDERGKVDANDWLVFGKATSEDCVNLLADAPVYAVYACHVVATADPMKRDEAIKHAIECMALLEPYELARHQKEAARLLGVSATEFGKMVKAISKDEKEKAGFKQEATLNNGFLDGYLFETIYEAGHEDGPRTAFAVCDPDGKLTITRLLETDHYKIMPPPPFNSIIHQEVIKLPSGLENYEGDVALQAEIQAFIHKYVDLPANLEMMASYYVMLTWIHDKFYTIPILRARGDYGSGKSRFLEAVGHLCMRTVLTSGSTTPSPFFRLNEMWQGMTLALDEADLPNSEASVEWMQMLNNGYKQGMPLLRTKISNGEADVEAFSVFGPKIIGMRGRFPDHATESRCITWETAGGRAIRDDIPRYYDRDEFEADALRIRNKLLMWRLKNYRDIEVDYEMEAYKHLPGRTVEIMVPLRSISKEPEFRQRIEDYMQSINDEEIMVRQATLTAKVLMGLFTAYYRPDEKAHNGDARDLLQVAHITRWANRIINRENEEGELDEDDDDKGPRKRGMSSHKIGRIIRNELNLRTVVSDSPRRVRVVEWDVQRINALMVRYGFEADVMELAREQQGRERLIPLYEEDKLPAGKEREWLERYLKAYYWFKPEITRNQGEIPF